MENVTGKKKPKKGFCETPKCLFGTFLLVVAVIAAVVCVTFFDPEIRRKYEAQPPWWKKTIVYQIYPRSFQDSDGDGVGDIKGIISRLSHFTDLHVGAIWLSPFFTSPMRDFGYDVANYTDVDPVFGNLTDFDQLISEAHKKGLKVIIDYVPNHTSNESNWFQMSRKASGDDMYADFYIWNEGTLLHNGSRIPPNNWQSVFEGSAWQWDELKQAYYYHAFLDSQPDLNYRNEHVLRAMDDVLRFWLDKGVDGFRIDAIPHLFELENQTVDEPPGPTNGFDPNLHKYTKNQPEVFSVVNRWRGVLDEYDGEKFLVAETVGISHEDRLRYYEAGAIPFFFDLVPVSNEYCGKPLADCYLDAIRQGVNVSGNWPNFVIGNHDNKRIADRIGNQYVDALNMMLLTLPGTPTTYYGEELGMRGGNYTGRTPMDPYAITSNDWSNSRDSERNPMQWDTSMNAGFSSGSPWLPVTSNTDYMRVNVQVEKNTEGSSLSLYKQLATLREKMFESDFDAQSDGQVLAYRRGNYLVALNLHTAQSTLRVTDVSPGSVVFSTTGRTGTVDPASLQLQSGEGIIVEAN